MTARRATATDIPRIVAMGRRFVAAAWGFPYDDDDAADYVRLILDQGEVFLNDDAMLGAILEPLPFNRSALVATELFWFNEGRKGAGLALFRAFEAWAVEVGAHQIVMSTVHEFNPGIARLYERRGYRLREQTFVRDI